MMQLLADPSKAANFARIVFDLLVQGQAGNVGQKQAAAQTHVLGISICVPFNQRVAMGAGDHGTL